MTEKSAEDLDSLLTQLYWDVEHGRQARGVEILQKLVRESKHAAMLEAHEIQQTMPPSEHWECGKAILTAAKKYED
jgi:hypothetical protein